MNIFQLHIRQTGILMYPVYYIIKYICYRKFRKIQICLTKMKISHNSTAWRWSLLTFGVCSFQFFPFLYMQLFLQRGTSCCTACFIMFFLSDIHTKHHSSQLQFMNFVNPLIWLSKPLKIFRFYTWIHFFLSPLLNDCFIIVNTYCPGFP